MDTLTAQQAADEAKMNVYTLRKYVNSTQPNRQPALKAKHVVVGNHVEIRIKRADFEAWLAAYQAKPAFGANLHKSRRVTE